MLHKYISYFIFLVVLLAGVQTLHAQKYRKSYYNGYVLMRKGDTLHGRIKLRHSFDKKVYLRDEKTDELSIIPTHGVEEIKINIMVFSRVKVRGKYHMYEKIAHGYYNLYGFTKATADFVRNYYYLAKGDENAIEITPSNFEKAIDKYIYDYPALRQRVLIGELKFNDIAYIFRRYNHWKENGE